MIAAIVPKSSDSARHRCALKLHRRANFGEVSNEGCAPVSTQIGGPAAAGTPVAINYLRLGVAPHFTCRTGRGGARNRASRESHELSTAQLANLIAAAGHAEVIGLPLTRMITIHWQAAGVPLTRMANATGRFVDLLSKALNRHGTATAWLWVHEDGHGKGGHCHLLAHVPASLVQRLTALQRGWLRRITGQPYRSRVILSKPIGGRLGLEGTNPELHAANARAVLAYVLKGASPAAAAMFNLTCSKRAVGLSAGAAAHLKTSARRHARKGELNEQSKAEDERDRRKAKADRG